MTNLPESQFPSRALLALTAVSWTVLISALVVLHLPPGERAPSVHLPGLRLEKVFTAGPNTLGVYIRGGGGAQL